MNLLKVKSDMIEYSKKMVTIKYMIQITKAIRYG